MGCVGVGVNMCDRCHVRVCLSDRWVCTVGGVRQRIMVFELACSSLHACVRECMSMRCHA